jgi:hypothetical protein
MFESTLTYGTQHYPPEKYGVGFFAAVVIAANDVVLNLNGYTLEQDPGFALLQRFYANIEIGD